MPSKKERGRMIEYVAGTLDCSGESINPTSGNVRGNDVNYIKVGDDGAVLMVDRAFGAPTFKDIYFDVRRQFSRVGAVFFKDGKTFFRSAAEKNYFKKDHQLSLKGYSDNEMHRMMLLRPEEIRVHSSKSNAPLQYYQPASERLEEGIVSFRFGPVVFDYSHIDSRYQFKPGPRESARLHIWRNKTELPVKLRLEGNILVDKDAPLSFR